MSKYDPSTMIMVSSAYLRWVTPPPRIIFQIALEMWPDILALFRMSARVSTARLKSRGEIGSHFLASHYDPK